MEYLSPMPDSQSATPAIFWKRCSGCKKEIPFKTTYYRCSVSTCRSKVTNFSFCSMMCWDGHLGMFNHRGSAYAEEETSPSP